jgi:hypothetical protein
MVRMGALGLRIGLRHIRAFLGLAVVVRSIAVVDVARSIHPNHARSAARRLRHRRSLRSRRRLRRRSRSSRRGGSRSRNLGSNRRWRWSRRWSYRSRRIPLLHALVPTAGPLFAGSRRISSVFTLTGSSGRCLSHRNLRAQKPHRNRHQMNRCLHKHSDKISILRSPHCATRTPQNPTPSCPTCHYLGPTSIQRRRRKIAAWRHVHDPNEAQTDPFEG